jgi:phosphohistidine phosphatase
MKTYTKTIYLVRHTNAEPLTEKLPNLERPLSEKGIEKAHKVCQKLKSKISDNSEPTILSSPAKRAQDTAFIFREYFNDKTIEITTLDWLYQDFDLETFLDYVAIANSNNIWCFGHNPSFLNLLQKLGDKNLKNFYKSMVVAINLTFQQNKELSTLKKSKLIFTVNPKLI